MPHYTVFGISMASGGEQLGEESIASPSCLSHVARGGGSTFGCWRSELLAGGSYALLRSPFLELALELGVSDGGRPLQGLDRRAEVVFEHTFDRRQNVRGDVIGLAAFLPVGQVCRGWETAVDLLEQITTARTWQAASPRAPCAPRCGTTAVALRTAGAAAPAERPRGDTRLAIHPRAYPPARASPATGPR
jgi:hypothetical protein